MRSCDQPEQHRWQHAANATPPPPPPPTTLPPRRQARGTNCPCITFNMATSHMLARAAEDLSISSGDTSLSSTAATAYLPLISSFISKNTSDPKAIWTSFSMIIFSEIGDKTFLIAAILSMRNPKLTVFIGAFLSLALMSILSSFLGNMFPTLLPKSLTTFLASILFFVFGAKMLKEGLEMNGDELGHEWEEAKREIEEEQQDDDEEESHELFNSNKSRRQNGSVDLEAGQSSSSYPNISPYPSTNGHTRTKSHTPSSSIKSSFTSTLKEGSKNLCGLCCSPILAQSFILTFLGEWGDRSQIATIALAAAHNIWLVSFGTIVGHSLCTGLAVLGGSWLANKISVKHVTLGGSILFLLFGFLYLFEAWSEFYNPTSQEMLTNGLVGMTENVAAIGGLAAPAPPVVDHPFIPAGEQVNIAQSIANSQNQGNDNLAEAMAAAVGRR
ncbi:unnamed protein product [Sympodiomycopsis kandeliae]